MGADTVLPEAKADAEVLGAGTTVRFVLLLVLIVISSSLTLRDLLQDLHDPDFNDIGCQLASGWDPGGSVSANFAASIGHNAQALHACDAKYELAGWVPVLVIVLLITAASALYYWLPLWKGRRNRVVPTDEIDPSGDLRSLLGELVTVAGLYRAPRFVVDPAATTTTAVVFGRPRRHTVCLHGGLVARRSVDAEGFRAVVLHELAHIRNRDVEITYATVALWRVFLLAVIIPSIISDGHSIFINLSVDSVVWPEAAPEIIRPVLFKIFLVGLVYLSRADILRSREVYADLAAAGWGATPGSWHHRPLSGASQRKVRRALNSFKELWLTHPRWDQREKLLVDSSTLFAITALPMFLAGAAADIVPGLTDLLPWSAPMKLTGAWVAAAAGLITGVIGVVLWRAVAHAVRTGQRVPSGLYAGLWFGCGIVAAELVQYNTTENRWLPDRPAALLIPVLLAVVTACWGAQCAELWVQTQRKRVIRLLAAPMLIGAWGIFTAGLIWWNFYGFFYAGRIPAHFVLDEQPLIQAYPGSAVAHSNLLLAVTSLWSLAPILADPFTVWTGPALWLLPLLAWSIPSYIESTRSAHSNALDSPLPRLPQAGLPPLRGVLVVAGVGGIVSWIATAAAMAYLHSWLPFGHTDRLYYEVYRAWLLAALAAGQVVTAAVVSARATSYRLPTALVAAGVATLVGYAGTFMLVAFGGCLGPLNALAAPCVWLPGVAWPITEDLPPQLLGGGMFAAAVVALLSIAMSDLTRTLTQRGAQHPTRVRGPANRPDRVTARRICVAVICVAALGLPIPSLLVVLNSPANQPASANQLTEQRMPTSAAVQPSPKVRKAQLNAWIYSGGVDLLKAYDQIIGGISQSLQTLDAQASLSAASKEDKNTFSHLRSLCVDLDQWAKKADNYFLIPNAQEQLSWSRLLTQARKVGADCQNVLDQQNDTMFQAWTSELLEMLQLSASVVDWLDANSG